MLDLSFSGHCLFCARMNDVIIHSSWDTKVYSRLERHDFLKTLFALYDTFLWILKKVYHTKWYFHTFLIQYTCIYSINLAASIFSLFLSLMLRINIYIKYKVMHHYSHHNLCKKFHLIQILFVDWWFCRITKKFCNSISVLKIVAQVQIICKIFLFYFLLSLLCSLHLQDCVLFFNCFIFLQWMHGGRRILCWFM